MANNLIQLIIEKAEKGSRFLDLGCGNGADSLFMAKKGFVVTSVDSSSECIDKLKKSAQQNNFKINANSNYCVRLEHNGSRNL